MDAIITAVMALLTALLNVVFNILTPPAAGPTPLQIIIYAGMIFAFLPAAVALIKKLASG